MIVCHAGPFGEIGIVGFGKLLCHLGRRLNYIELFFESTATTRELSYFSASFANSKMATISSAM